MGVSPLGTASAAQLSPAPENQCGVNSNQRPGITNRSGLRKGSECRRHGREMVVLKHSPLN